MASRFLFHASAVGVTGQIDRPTTHVIPSVASALPTGGGHNNAKQDPGELIDIYSHGGATTAVTGNQKQDEKGEPIAHVTTTTATVHGLNIGNVVRLDSVTASLASVHPADGSQARFNTQGSVFQNLRIAGREIRLESRVDLHNEASTLDELRKRYRENLDFRRLLQSDMFAGNENRLHEKQKKFFPWCKWTNANDLPVSKSTGICIVPLFIVKNPSEPGFQVSGNVITVDDFGTIVLGELIISAYERRLTMLHADLGSPVGGMVSAAAVDGNGGGTDP